MKKIVSILACLILAYALCITAFAASASLSGVPSELKKDATATVTVTLSGTPSTSSALVQVSLGSGLELVSGAWQKDGPIKEFNASKGEGVLALSEPSTLDGTAFSFVVKGKAVSSAAQNITVNFTFKNGSSEVGSATASASVKVVCATHTMGSYTNANANQHSRTCSACGYTENANHTWNAGEVIKTANCKEAGTKHYTCTTCSATKDEAIAKTNNHTFGSWSQTSTPSCTGKGQEKRTCSTCQKEETRDVNALGHSFGSWSQTKAPTCTAQGGEQRSCSRCSHKETRAVNALGHAFSNPTVTKAPTCTETGIESGTCTRCGQTTTNTIPATGHSFGAWADTKAATCTEKGVQEHKCSKCNSIETRETEALGHDFDEAVVVKEPTLTEKGIMEGVCKTCGNKTQAEIPCVFKDETTGIEIKPEDGVFQTGTEIKIEVIEKDHANYETVKTALKEVASEFVAYDVSAIRENAVVQPNGTVAVSFKIPEGFGKNVAVFYISDDGVSEKLEAVVSEDGKTIVATLTHFSSYAVVKLAEVEADTDTDASVDENAAPVTTKAPTKEEGGVPVGLIVCIVVIVALIGGACWYFFIFKKK